MLIEGEGNPSQRHSCLQGFSFLGFCAGHSAPVRIGRDDPRKSLRGQWGYGVRPSYGGPPVQPNTFLGFYPGDVWVEEEYDCLCEEPPPGWRSGW